MRITFWGVRGSIACPAKTHLRYGGNTSCVEVAIGDEHIILDAGTGIRMLGNVYLRQDRRRGTVLLSHTHWDHIQGFPFFSPAFDPKRSFRILAGHLPAAMGGIRTVLAGQMAEPNFPVPLEIMRGSLTFEDFTAGDHFGLGPGIRVRTTTLNHPNGATGYRIEANGASVCYITDTEHVIGKPDQNILALIEGADLLIYDSTYTDLEFPTKIGWGHSTWQEAVRLTQAAHVRKLAIFHHEPDHDDRFMRDVEVEARAILPNCFVAREGQTVRVVGRSHRKSK
ncbi:MAG: MBL fold metallo-hydrolase [Polyangiaceae bacterium]